METINRDKLFHSITKWHPQWNWTISMHFKNSFPETHRKNHSITAPEKFIYIQILIRLSFYLERATANKKKSVNKCQYHGQKQQFMNIHNRNNCSKVDSCLYLFALYCLLLWRLLLSLSIAFCALCPPGHNNYYSCLFIIASHFPFRATTTTAKNDCAKLVILWVFFHVLFGGAHTSQSFRTSHITNGNNVVCTHSVHNRRIIIFFYSRFEWFLHWLWFSTYNSQGDRTFPPNVWCSHFISSRRA